MTVPVISYHYPCPDGVFAALAAHLRFAELGVTPVWIPNTVYSPRRLQDLHLQATQTLYMLDFVGPAGFAQAAAELGARVILLDHHKTAFGMFEAPESQHPNLDVQLDMSRSGATISLGYFRPQVSQDLQKLFDYVEDADLWKWKLPDSKAFHAGLGSLKLEYDANKNPSIFQQLCALQLNTVIQQGHLALKQQDELVSEAVRSAFTVQLGGSQGLKSRWGRCLGVRADRALSQIRSTVGNELAQASAKQGLRPIGVVAYIEEAMGDRSKMKVSLRSVGDEDTTDISQAFGGGGHRNASSFIVDTIEFESWIMMTR